LSELIRVLPCAGTLTTFVLALGTFLWRRSRARLLDRAGIVALEKGDDDPQGRAGLAIVKMLNDDEPWFKAILPWRRSDDGEP
jgi:hypothetical protein